MMLRDIRVRDNRAGGARRKLGEETAGLRDETLADDDVVAPSGQLDTDFDSLVALRFARRAARRYLRLERAHHILTYVLVRSFAQADRHVGLRIDWLALGKQPPHRGDRIRRLQKRARRAPAYAPHQRLDIGLEPDRNRILGDARAGRLVHERAAAGRHDPGPAGEHTRHDAPFAIAEMILAVTGENIGDRHARRLDDLLIDIDER